MGKKLVVAFGKAITSKKGILEEGTAVDAEDFVGGEETVAALLEKGKLSTWADFKKTLHLMGIKKAAPDPVYTEVVPVPESEAVILDTEEPPELKLGGARKFKK